MKRILLFISLLILSIITKAQTWDSVGPATYYNISVLYSDTLTSSLYAGGSLVQAGGIPVNNIAKWDGTSWSAMGAGIPDHIIYTINSYNGELYAGGLAMGYGVTGGLFKWDGTNWIDLDANNDVIASIVYNNELYVGGWFDTIAGNQIYNIAKWNGIIWDSVGNNYAMQGVYALQEYNGELFATGTFNNNYGVHKWNGTTWTTVGIMNGEGNSMEVYNGELYVNGNFDTIDNIQCLNIARWNGTNWLSVGAGIGVLDSLFGCSAWNSLKVYNGELYSTVLVGHYEDAYIARWNGTSWNPLGTGIRGNNWLGALGVYNGELYVACDNNDTAGTIPLNYIARWQYGNDVWPGDVDNNSLVNNNDLLPIGLHYGQTGVQRNTISNLWQADTVSNWGISETNGADIKHIDCNGDGIIDFNDTLAINLNFSSTHAIMTYANEERLNSPDIYLSVIGSSYNAGDWVDASLWLGSSTNPVNNLYGIAFNINYTSSFVQSGTENIVYTDSWLGTPGTNVIKFSKSDALSNVAYGAETRINHTNANGFGKIADFKFQVNTFLNSVADINLLISDYIAVDNTGTTVVFNKQPTLIYVVGIDEQNNNSEISIAPNPFTSQTTIFFNVSQKHTTIKIMDVVGKDIKTINFSGNQLTLEKEEMQTGIYFIQITDENKNTINRKIVIK